MHYMCHFVSASCRVCNKMLFPQSSHLLHKMNFKREMSVGNNTTVNANEVEKFGRMASDWWQPNGILATLHTMNALRVPLVRDGLLDTAVPQKLYKQHKPLESFEILDVGCGGGILAEPLARLGASVTGVDPSLENINTATNHALTDNDNKNKITYVCGTVEDLVTQNRKFDAVVCSEVVEHVDNIRAFIEACVSLVKDNGSLFFTTVNRTTTSYIAAIILAEYVTGLLPRGTHDWKKFVKPSDLEKMLESHGCRTHLIHGMLYNPLSQKWCWSDFTHVGYALHAIKENAESNS